MCGIGRKIILQGTYIVHYLHHRVTFKIFFVFTMHNAQLRNCILKQERLPTLIKKKKKFYSYIGTFRKDRTNGLLIYCKIFAHFLMY
jgi:hypothetical protein